MKSLFLLTYRSPCTIGQLMLKNCTNGQFILKTLLRGPSSLDEGIRVLEIESDNLCFQARTAYG